MKNPPDRRLRELERRARESGGVEDQRQLENARLQTGLPPVELGGEPERWRYVLRSPALAPWDPGFWSTAVTGAMFPRMMLARSVPGNDFRSSKIEVVEITRPARMSRTSSGLWSPFQARFSTWDYPALSLEGQRSPLARFDRLGEQVGERFETTERYMRESLLERAAFAHSLQVGYLPKAHEGQLGWITFQATGSHGPGRNYLRNELLPAHPDEIDWVEWADTPPLTPLPGTAALRGWRELDLTLLGETMTEEGWDYEFTDSGGLGIDIGHMAQHYVDFDTHWPGYPRHAIVGLVTDDPSDVDCATCLTLMQEQGYFASEEQGF